MNLNKVKLIQLMHAQLPVPSKLLQAYIHSTFENSFNLIVNLFCESQLIITDYLSFKNYVVEVANVYFNLYPIYTYEEQQWLIFLIIMQLYTIEYPSIEKIIYDYEHLPSIEIKNKYMKDNIKLIKSWILSYYVVLNKDYDTIITELDELEKI